MEQYKYVANEKFFDNLLSALNENGTFIWKDELIPFKKIGDKFYANQYGLDRVKRIVRPEYFQNHFELSE